jgi:tetratricopeptide (TPR) repeat protein
LLLSACSLEKESKFNRAMQNLTAHYNILFNANDLLKQKQELYEAGYIDAYDRILIIYQDTVPHSAAADKELDATITKANTIISTKEQSHYIGDAYLVLGKANHLYGHYFNAVEFCRYVTLSYPKNKELVQEARVWQTRSLLYLNQIPEAKLVLDSALKNVNPKKSITADVYATALQYHIDKNEYPDAEAAAKLALKYVNNKQQRLRWTFILAQLQELNNEPKEAFLNYSNVVKSNAPFEMAFNADLNRIRLEDMSAGRHLTRMERLRRLLRDDKNNEFIDQIYYQIALLYLAGNDIDNAIKNLQLAVRNSTKNQNQKGLSYLKLADINFKIKGDYVQAKKYYDSTLTNLSSNYPDYTLIQKKNNNLQVLASRLQIIGREDTLQMLAKLSDSDRAARINELVARRSKQLQAASAAATAPADPLNNAYNNVSPQSAITPVGTSTFYFDNSLAVSQGYADFKRVWGNRKLEDNWRRSKRLGADAATNNASLLQDPDALANPQQGTGGMSSADAAAYRQGLVQNLPLTPQKLDQSNMRIYNAYLDIANFYRDVLNDKKEAIEAYETLLGRYPNDPNKAATYYNLYRLYSDINTAKSDYYKNLLLTNYPNSLYAKVILDPDYNRKLDSKDVELTAQYNSVYELYTKRKYKEVIAKTDSLTQAYPDNKFAAQLFYLRTIANGHQEKLGPFREELLAIVTKYPNDRLIAPLVNQHIVYVDANKAKLAAREFVLMDSDPTEEPFIPAVVPQQVIVKQQVQSQPMQKAVLQNQPVKQVTPPVNNPLQNITNTGKKAIANNLPTATATGTVPPQAASIFSLRDSTNYYFVVNVSSGTVNLSSSRFGIGQFNRVNYKGSSITHQLTDAGNDNQLIYVGRFTNLVAVKDYARAIIPLMPQIMKVPADKYMFFIITKENLDKLADKKTLDSYIDFYQKTY